MSQHDFDKELQDLYQKRKQHIKVPDVALPFVHNQKKRVSKPAIFMLGGLSAFALMAIVNHYQPPKKPQDIPVQTIKYVLEVAPYEKAKEDNIVISHQALPEKPRSVLPAVPPLTVIPANNFSLDTDIDLLNESIEPIELPRMQEPNLLVKPSYRVMPRYDEFDLDGSASASIELSYQVDKMGNVTSIDIIESSANRKLQKLSVKALSQWRYRPLETEQGEHQQYRVVFDFTTDVDLKNQR